jgi:DNA-binding NtrC family response regulator
VANLPPELSAPPKARLPFAIDLHTPLTDVVRDTVAQIERQYIRKALKKTHGHVGRCARICGLSRRSITSKIATYQLDKSLFKND